MATPGIQSAPRARPDVILRRVDSEWVLYDAATERAHALNLTAAVIWTYCDGSFQPAGIADAIAHEVPGLDVGVIRRDIHDVLRRFADEGLLQ